ncbi:IclR family transcriptional regulator [Natronorubrum sp. FCH18a]|uniref:IclR family transcriptional regulator n=1 Tax=Natronorubrum sp. FCH18a TaxID=3447018 RepID=UPI003F50E971
MDDNDSGTNLLETVQMSVSITETLAEMEGGRVTEVADTIDVPKSTIHRHLKTLEKLEYLSKEGDEYKLGMKYLRFGEHVKYRKKAYELAEEKVNYLATKTGERALFIVEEHGNSVFVHRAIGDQAVEVGPDVGERTPIHASAAGKTILAFTPDIRRREILDNTDITRITSHTIEDPDELVAELERIREQGYSTSNEEYMEGLNAVSVPIRAPTNQVVGALSIGGPAHRLTQERLEGDLATLLLGTANEIELNISD